MNKINKYLLTGIVSLSMTACANLDLNPLSEGSSENWYHDETEIEMALNDLWRPDFFPIDAIYWDDDLLNRKLRSEQSLLNGGPPPHAGVPYTSPSPVQQK